MPQTDHYQCEITLQLLRPVCGTWVKCHSFLLWMSKVGMSKDSLKPLNTQEIVYSIEAIYLFAADKLGFYVVLFFVINKKACQLVLVAHLNVFTSLWTEIECCDTCELALSGFSGIRFD